ncbi:MAG: baseplate J/gp47 family protein [Desulfovibrio sp.]|jgi:uncharacterized phage protein gp47/JayE|nr:baseplate J/gp47 family protein [Desulfovibrio sp.]
MAAEAYIDDYGIHVPSYPEALDDLKAEFRRIYGQDVYLEPDSQEGALCAVFALRIYDCYALAASVYNAYSPSTAQGVGLSSVVKTNGIRRRAATYSHADLRIIGQAGTTIINGIASDEAERRWLLPEIVTIPVGGEITVTARAEEIGEMRAGPGEIKNIATPTRGWQAVINPLAAVTGAGVETDAALRTRQRISTALPSRSIFDGTAGAVAQLPGIIRSRGYENDTDQYDANGIPPHSIAFVAEGGDTQAIGEAIAVKKGPGCGTYGTTRVQTVDKWGAPQFIHFFRPEIVNVAVEITVKALTGYLATTGETIRRNVAAWINAQRIGDDLLLSKLYTPINQAEPVPGERTYDLLSLRLGVVGWGLAQANLGIAFTSAASCAVEDIVLIVTE